MKSKEDWLVQQWDLGVGLGKIRRSWSKCDQNIQIKGLSLPYENSTKRFPSKSYEENFYPFGLENLQNCKKIHSS